MCRKKDITLTETQIIANLLCEWYKPLDIEKTLQSNNINPKIQ